MKPHPLTLPQNISQEFLDCHPKSFKITKQIKTTDIDNCLIKNEFQLLKLLFKTKKHVHARNSSPRFKKLNRYRDVIPYNHNIVTTDRKQLHYKNYINANYINNPFKSEKSNLTRKFRVSILESVQLRFDLTIM